MAVFDGSRRALVGAFFATLLPGCALWRPVTVPMATIALPAPCAARPDTLLVMLPGSYSRPEDFEREGFVEAVREQRIAADVLLVDAHVGYYSERSIVERLRADVVAPARARGYRHIWLVGISIGAFGTLLYNEAQTQPEGIAGIVLLGPYLGRRELTAEIASQGGLQRWRAPSGPLGPDDADAAVWRWLQPYANPVADARRPALYLGYGIADRFASSDALLAAALPPDHVFTTEGGHDWPPWGALWRHMLVTLPLPRGDSCTPAAAR